jgi:hypothetical protein
MRQSLFVSLFLAALLAPAALAQPTFGGTVALGIANADGDRLAYTATGEYRNGSRAYTVRSTYMTEIFGDNAAEFSVMGGIAQNGRGLGGAWLVAGPSLFVYEDRQSCFLSGLFGDTTPCTSSSSYSYHPGLAVGAGATLFQLGPVGVGGYLFGNLNPKAPMAGATLQFSISGTAGRR